MAAGVTPAVKALTDVLTEAVANSKIIAALDKVLSQTLGLLVDLILLPFLPILIWVLKGLLSWVIDFGKWWNDFWKGSGKVLIDGIVALGAAIAGGIGAIIDFGLKLGGALVELGIGFLKWLWGVASGTVSAAIDFAFNAAGAVYDLLVWVWDIATKAKEIAFDVLFNKIPGLVGDLLNWLWDLGTGAIKFLADLGITIPEPVNSILKWLMDIAGGVVSFTIDIAKNIGGAVGGAIGGAFDWAKDIFGFASGGVVPGAAGEPRIVKAHGGETILPASQSAAGGLQVSISGTLFRDEEDMYLRVLDRIRGELWRQNV